MFQNVITSKTQRVLASLSASGLVKDFYLAGGTALALQFGHRQSIDLDFFKFKSFSTRKLKEKLRKFGKLKVDSEDKDTLNCKIDGVKVSFLGYPYKLLFAKKKMLKNIYLADPRDIAAMKIDAISDRGSKKDFIDLYFLLEKYSLKHLADLFDKKYKGIDYNRIHILKSLVYFIDADKEQMPKMLKNVSWRQIKDRLKAEVK